MLRKTILMLLMAFAFPLEASARELNLLGGYGIIGPDQYDQGKVRAVLSVNLTGFVDLGDSWSLGGLGVVSRTNPNLHSRFDEFAPAVPFVTYHRGRAVAQLGVGIQRLNMMKNFYYVSVGIRFWKRPEREDRSRNSSIQHDPNATSASPRRDRNSATAGRP